MEAIIRDRLFELDLQGQAVQQSNVIINQGNINSFKFIFKIYDGATEISPEAFTVSRLTLSQGSKAFYHSDLDQYLELVPGAEAYGRAGVVIGQLDLEFSAGNLATLHFSFVVLKSLANLPAADRQIYINEIVALINEMNLLVDEARAILEELQDDSFVTHAELEEALANLPPSGVTEERFNTEISNINNSLEQKANENSVVSRLADKLNRISPTTEGNLTVSAPDYALSTLISTAADHLYYLRLQINPTYVYIQVMDKATNSVLMSQMFDPLNKFLVFNALYLQGNVDNTASLGRAAIRWKDIYASNGVIQTSDEREKENIMSIDEKYINFLMELDPVVFKFKNDENNEYYRMHCGLIAQEVEKALYNNGLNSLDFAGLTISPIVEEIDGEKVITGDKYGLRYEEFIPLLIETAQIQQEKIDSLETRILKLEKMINK